MTRSVARIVPGSLHLRRAGVGSCQGRSCPSWTMNSSRNFSSGKTKESSKATLSAPMLPSTTAVEIEPSRRSGFATRFVPFAQCVGSFGVVVSEPVQCLFADSVVNGVLLRVDAHQNRCEYGPAKPDSFEAAVTIGRALQNCNGCTVIAIDKSEHPHRRYSISGNGKPTLLPRL